MFGRQSRHEAEDREAFRRIRKDTRRIFERIEDSDRQTKDRIDEHAREARESAERLATQLASTNSRRGVWFSPMRMVDPPFAARLATEC
jgi:hypothetical protein